MQQFQNGFVDGIVMLLWRRPSKNAVFRASTEMHLHIILFPSLMAVRRYVDITK